MKNRIVNKVRSQTGASIIFALLIFLVCAVVGSAVLTAGTAAAGRMSRAAEMDQRYYSVNSAARLLIDQIDGKSVTIVETAQGSDKSYKFVDEPTPIAESSGFASIVKEAAYYYVKNIAPTGVSNRTVSSSDTSLDNRFKLTLGGSDALTAENTYPALNVELAEEIRDDGSMILTVSQGIGERVFAMDLTFNSDIKNTVDTQTRSGNTITTTTWNITWNIQHVEIIGTSLRVN